MSPTTSRRSGTTPRQWARARWLTPSWRSSKQVRRAAAVLVAGVLAAACSSGPTAAVKTTPVAAAPVIGPSLDRADQPSFSYRTGLPPPLSLHELFHPVYNVPPPPPPGRR